MTRFAYYGDMTQQSAWDNEYRQKRLVTTDDLPQASVRRFFQFLKKQDIDFAQVSALDLGCGTGRNALELARRGANAVGLDFSPTAIAMAEKKSRHAEVPVEYHVHNIGQPYPFADNSFDIVLDVTSSNALSDKERQVYCSEVERVLKPGGWLFVRTLCKEGDKNAQNLLRLHPGPEPDTYIFPGLGVTERVFTEVDLRRVYERFSIVSLKKDSGYAQWNNQAYKRKYWELTAQLI